jgi:hypothetical protein
MNHTKSPIGRSFTAQSGRDCQKLAVASRRATDLRLRARLARTMPAMSLRVRRRLAAVTGIQLVADLLADHADDLAAASKAQ